jgi:hypothetical protein
MGCQPKKRQGGQKMQASRGVSYLLNALMFFAFAVPLMFGDL